MSKANIKGPYHPDVVNKMDNHSYAIYNPQWPEVSRPTGEDGENPLNQHLNLEIVLKECKSPPITDLELNLDLH